jgi:hypothetical protein
MTPDVASDSSSGRTPDPAANLLNGRHQWIAEYEMLKPNWAPTWE